MNKIIMPEMPDFSEIQLKDKIQEKCNLVSKYGKCPGDENISCDICALKNVYHYTEWKVNKQKYQSNLVKWPAVTDKDMFFVLPRYQVNKMPKPWKKSFLKLLFQFVKENGLPGSLKGGPLKFRVFAVKNGQGVKLPDEFKNFDK